MKRESDFQSELIRELEKRFPGIIVMKNDCNYIQGIPDLTLLYEDKWATLECKKSVKELKDPRPNQPYYIELMNRMSFSSFIYPENREEILDALQRTFKPGRPARLSRSK